MFKRATIGITIDVVRADTIRVGDIVAHSAVSWKNDGMGFTEVITSVEMVGDDMEFEADGSAWTTSIGNAVMKVRDTR